MNNTQKALINQDVCEQTTPNLGITQSSGLDHLSGYPDNRSVAVNGSIMTAVRVEMRSALSAGFIITVTLKPSKRFWAASRVQYTHLLLIGRNHHKNRLHYLKRIPICGASLPT